MLTVWALAVCGTWMAMAVTLVGIGFGAHAILPSKDSCVLDALWLGLAVAVALLEIWNLVLPINFWATISLLLLGSAGLVASRGALLEKMGHALSGRQWWMVVPFGIVLLLAIRACGPCDYGDTGLYGWPAVQWASTYPAVPGLANLHGRLGYNSAVFLCVAALDQGAWRDRAHHLFTGFMMAAIVLAIVPGCVRAVRRTLPSPSDWFQTILAIPVVFWVTRTKIVGTETDEPATVACLAGATILFDVLCVTPGEDNLNRGSSRLMVGAGLLALAIAFKESTIVFAVLALCLAMAWIWKKESWAAGRQRVYFLAAVGISLAVLLPWCVRGIILSGYPFFPATILGFPVGWKVPLEQARWFADGVKSFGRNPDAYFFRETQGFGWLRGWLRLAIRDRVSFQVPMAISLAGLAAALGFRGRRERGESGRWQWIWLVLPSLAGIVFWFWASPAMRFGQFAIWTAAATLGTWGIMSLTNTPHGPRAELVFVGLLGLCVWCLAGYGWKAPYRALVTTAPLARVPVPEVTTRTTRSGLQVDVPAEINCWDARVPCTPYFDETLRLRDGLSLRRGFVSDPRSEELRKLRLAPLQ